MQQTDRQTDRQTTDRAIAIGRLRLLRRRPNYWALWGTVIVYFGPKIE